MFGRIARAREKCAGFACVGAEVAVEVVDADVEEDEAGDSSGDVTRTFIEGKIGVEFIILWRRNWIVKAHIRL